MHSEIFIKIKQNNTEHSLSVRGHSIKITSHVRKLRRKK